MSSRKLFEEAHRRYWDALERNREPDWSPFPYSVVDEVRKGKWPPFIDMMVADELRESINLMNAWNSQLFDWRIWSEVLPTFSETDRWTIQIQQVDPLAFACMYQAGAMRERFCMAATNALHQANLATVNTYRDELDEDALPPGRFLSRVKKEKQLRRLGSGWKAFSNFESAMCAINTAEYRTVTRNFRNQSSHAIAPRFEIGYTNTVIRYRTPRETTVPQPDGSYTLARDPSRTVIAYGFGGTPPLKNEEMVGVTTKQHALAAATLIRYVALLREVLAKIGVHDPANPNHAA